MIFNSSKNAVYNDSALTLDKFLGDSRKRIEGFLSTGLSNTHSTLTNAMQYALLSGGKRLRSAMIYSIEARCHVSSAAANHIAAAIECVHASSLTHDDLPAIDDDHWRRGKPACHIAFDEATAILTGDALLNLAHQFIHTIPTTTISANSILKIAKYFTRSIGHEGLMDGQATELGTPHSDLNEEKLLDIYHKKTGLLFGTGLKLVLLAAEMETTAIAAQLDKFSYHLGLAFQIQDDIIDVESPSELSGKPQYSDQNSGRYTMVDCIGLNTAKQRVVEHINAATRAIQSAPEGFQRLQEIALFVMNRSH